MTQKFGLKHSSALVLKLKNSKKEVPLQGFSGVLLLGTKYILEILCDALSREN